MSQSSLRTPSTQPQAEEPSIIQYTNLLHQYRDPGAEAVVAIVKAHQTDDVFLRRVEVLNKVFLLKADLLRPEV